MVFLAMRRYGFQAVLALILSLQLAFRWAVIPYGTDYNALTFVVPWGLPGRLLEFGLGVWCADFVSRGRGEQLGSTHRVGLGMLATAMAASAIYAKPRLGVTHPVVDLAWTVCFCSILLLSSSPRTIVHRVMRQRPLRALGAICYSVYLVHELAMGYIVQLLELKLNMKTPALLGACTLAAVIACSSAFYLTVERVAVDFFAGPRRRAEPAISAN